MKWPDDYINKIICGDCLEVMKGIPDNSVDLVITDPPYGVNWQSNRRIIKHEHIENDDDLSWALPVYSEIYRAMKKDSLMVSFYSWTYVEIFMNVWKQIGLKPKSNFVWVKNNFGLGWFTRGQHEDAYLLAKGSPSKPKKAISDVLDWKGTGNELHPTQKPIGALIPLIETYTEQGGVILDPFNGSGTTCVASKELGRDFIGIEINPKYCEIAQRRLAQEYLFT